MAPVKLLGSRLPPGAAPGHRRSRRAAAASTGRQRSGVLGILGLRLTAKARSFGRLRARLDQGESFRIKDLGVPRGLDLPFKRPRTVSLRAFVAKFALRLSLKGHSSGRLQLARS